MLHAAHYMEDVRLRQDSWPKRRFEIPGMGLGENWGAKLDQETTLRECWRALLDVL
jgi:hypothetical protein